MLSESMTPFVDAARQLPDLPSRDLVAARVPGDSGRFGVGHTFDFLWRNEALMRELREAHGPNFRLQLFGWPILVVGGPVAVSEVLLDREKNFSTERGWGGSIGELFRGGLLLRDFEEHKSDRRVVQSAFRHDAVRGYVALMEAPIRETIAAWPRELRLYDAFKALTLDLAARIFLGLSLGPDCQTVNRAFSAAADAAIAVVRKDWSFCAYGRGLRGRRQLERVISQLVPERRLRPGSDLMSQLCQSKSDDGERFSDEAVCSQMIFMLMAAHDTTTSALASLVHLLLENPDWHARVRDEIRARGPAPITWEDRSALPTVDRCFDEALRLYPPVPFLARRSVRACTVAGLSVPANTGVSVAPVVTHRLPEYWREPERFDPDRFLPERAEHTAHSHLYYPFGSGPHVCMGSHLARIQAKAVLSELFNRYEVTARWPGRKRTLAPLPIPHPRDGLPVVLHPA